MMSASATKTPTEAAKSKKSSARKKGRPPPELLRLEQDDPSLTSLHVSASRGFKRRRKPTNFGGRYFRPRTDEEWRRLGDAVARSTNLRRMDLRDCNPPGGFFRGLDENESIRRLVLKSVSPRSIRRFLRENPNLASLTVSGELGRSEGPQFLTGALAERTASLKYLDLSLNGLRDEACQELATALLSGHSNLRSLELNFNFIRGCESIASLLRDPSSSLVRLYLDNNLIDDEGAEAMAASLTNNKRLKTLSIYDNTAITSRGYKAFSRVLCHAPQIDDILQSNHTVQRIGTNSNNLPEELKSSLRLNQSANKKYVANRKMLMHRLIYNFDTELFEGIPAGLVPSVLAMIADHAKANRERTDAEANEHRTFLSSDFKLRHMALHRIIRICPSVCERHVCPDDGPSLSGGRTVNDTVPSAPKKMRLC